MKLLRWIVLPPVVLAAMALAVANRAPVAFSLDPFDSASPAFSIEVPLFLIVLLSILAGILIGGMGAWAQARRKAAGRAVPAPSAGLPALRDEGQNPTP